MKGELDDKVVAHSVVARNPGDDAISNLDCVAAVELGTFDWRSRSMGMNRRIDWARWTLKVLPLGEEVGRRPTEIQRPDLF